MTPPGQSNSDEDDGLLVPVHPSSFAELGAAVSSKGCRRCGEPATHSVSIRVSQLGQGRGQNQTTASHKTTLCEACAVQVFAATRKAMR